MIYLIEGKFIIIIIIIITVLFILMTKHQHGSLGIIISVFLFAPHQQSAAADAAV
jgi:hypothetical protein